MANGLFPGSASSWPVGWTGEDPPPARTILGRLTAPKLVALGGLFGDWRSSPDSSCS